MTPDLIYVEFQEDSGNIWLSFMAPPSVFSRILTPQEAQDLYLKLSNVMTQIGKREETGTMSRKEISAAREGTWSDFNDWSWR